jgi:lipopolysaccharide/colanic/teichoic acid biosynthesis glycosyltransferase
MFSAASPVIAVSALTISILSRRSPFVAHLRVGQYGQPIWVLKLRTMWDRSAREQRAGRWLERVVVERIVAEPDEDRKDPFDPRVVSRFAAFCRRHSIDEFPQLWQVATGEMSLVGPRPLTRTEVQRHFQEHAEELLSAKPGLTGLWQVYGRSDVGFPERAAMDLELIREKTAATYLKILFRTLPAVIYGKGAR